MCKKRIALISNTTIDLLKQRLDKEYNVVIPEGYDTWVLEAMNQNSQFYSNEYDSIIILLDGTWIRSVESEEIIQETLSVWKQAVNEITNHYKNIPVFISTIDVRINRIKAIFEKDNSMYIQNDWYECIYQLTQENDNVYVFNTNELIVDVGRNHFYSDKMWYISGMPYSKHGLLCLVREIKRILQSVFDSRKKILVLDLDNTLWGGVIGEDGVEGIELSNHKQGQRYYDFQKQILEIQKRGVLLAINSKNNENDVLEVFTKHSSMLLNEDCFAAKKINWNNKSLNIKELETELNLTESSFVFIDDNPIEREIVGGECTDVIVPEFPIDTTTLISFAEEVYKEYFRPLKVLEEDLKKTNMYQEESKRKELYNSDINYENYISILEIEIDIHQMELSELDRVVQLCNKTNQFNLTTKRYTKNDILNISKDENSKIYVTYVKDKYGDSGLVGLVIVKEEIENVIIDTFLMSCRVMGRQIENAIINEILSSYTGKKSSVIACYYPTKKNIPVANLYDQLDFVLTSDELEIKQYHYNLDEFVRKEFNQYKKIIFKSEE